MKNPNLSHHKAQAAECIRQISQPGIETPEFYGCIDLDWTPLLLGNTDLVQTCPLCSALI